MKSCIFAPEKNADDSVICDQTASWDGHLMYASSEEFRGPTCIISVTAYSFSDSIYNDLRRSTVASSLVSQRGAVTDALRKLGVIAGFGIDLPRSR